MTASRALVGIAIRSIQAAPVDVTVPQHRVLVLLASHGGLGVGTIATHLGVNPSNATRLCDRLQRLHLVERRRSDEDGRAVQVRLTASGRNVVKMVNDGRRREIASVLRQLRPEDAQQALTGLTAFNEAAGERSTENWDMAGW